MPGLTPTGFTVPTIDEIRAELSAAGLARIGADLDTSDYSVFGQLAGIQAEQLQRLWLAARDVYAAFQPGSAAGVSLTSLASLTGTVRQLERLGVLTLAVTLQPGDTLPAGSQARQPGNDQVAWATRTTAVNAGGSPLVVSVICDATVAGPYFAPAGTVTELLTPSALGTATITNTTDATPGALEESDSELRARREIELRASGSGNLDAILADVRQVSGVLSVSGQENATGATVGVLPPYSFRIIVWDNTGAANDDIAQAIWDSHSAGCQAHGSSSGTAVDAEGATHTVVFDRATELQVYLALQVRVDSTVWTGAPSVDAIKAALVARSLSWSVGQPVYRTSMYGPVFAAGVGVLDVASLSIGTTPSPSGTADVVPTVVQMPRLDATRITVTVVP